MEKLKNKLSGEYWCGKRWLVYDSLKLAGWLGRLRFFSDYSEAVAWCKAASDKNGVFRIRVLAEVLAGLNGVWQKPYSSDEKRQLAHRLQYRPVSGYKKAIPLQVGLREHRYFPVLWNFEMKPLSGVKTWEVISGRRDGQDKCRTQVVGSFPDFGRAMIAFMRAIRKVSVLGPEVQLIGRLEATDMGTPGLVTEILFYRFVSAGLGPAPEFEPEIEQINDPTEPVILQSPYFASYDRPHEMIHFYDGGLRKVEAGKDRCWLDLEYFDFEGNEIFDLKEVL
jgi:hypothetical protein